MEAEIKKELSEEEWMEEVKKWLADCNRIRLDLSKSLLEAYKEIMY